MTVTAGVRRVSIRAAARESDVTLAADVPLRELLPALLDLVTPGFAEPADGRVSLRHPVAGALDEARSLADCGVRDGDLLILAPDPPAAPVTRFDPCATVAETVGAVRATSRPGTARTAAVAAVAWSAALAALLLGRPLVDPSAPRHAALCAVAAAAVMAATVLFGLAGAGSAGLAGLGCGTAVLAGVGGALLVPGGPGLANVSLAMSVCAATALLAARVLPCGSAVLVALCAAAGGVAAASLVATLELWPPSSTGPALAGCALAALTTAPRLAAGAAGLSALEPGDPALPAATRTAHRRLDALVVAASATAAAGCVLTSVASPSTAGPVCFVLAVAAALGLAARIHDRPPRCTALLAAAGIAATAVTATAVLANPARTTIACGALVALGAALTWWGLRPEPAPAAIHRLLGAAELAVAMAVVPLGCWAGGLFAAVREWAPW